MKIIAVMSPKGGIGKTATADALAEIIGIEKGKKVLILDGDPQADTSKIFGAFEPEGVGMSELLERHICVGGTYHTEDLICRTDFGRIDIIPANGYLSRTDMVLAAQEDKQITRLCEALESCTDKYDYCICDCGRLLDMVVLNMLIAADIIIAPVKAGGFEAEALAYLRDQVMDLKEINPKLKMKTLLTMKQKNKMTEDFEKWLRDYSGFEVYETGIRRSAVVEKATIGLTPLLTFSKNCIAICDYREVAQEVITEMEDIK